jgi:hypothetical protein
VIVREHLLLFRLKFLYYYFVATKNVDMLNSHFSVEFETDLHMLKALKKLLEHWLSAYPELVALLNHVPPGHHLLRL